MTALLFDLDGTLVDSGPGIVTSIRIACSACDLAEPDEETIWQFVGPPLHVSLREHYGIDDRALADEFTRQYRRSYLESGIHEGHVYAGMQSFLGELRAAGRRIFVATSKPRVHAKTMLEGHGLASTFDGIYGSELDGSLFDKAELIAFLLDREQVNPEHAIMIGDRKYDIEGARANNVESVGVLWGYGSHSELRGAGATRICDDVGGLARHVAELSRDAFELEPGNV